MDSKNYTDVLIDGKIYTLGGTEEEGYLQRVASYINERITTLKKQEGFTRQSLEYQNVMVELNIADDFFKAQGQAMELERQKGEIEKEVYSLKHELVSTQMKLDHVQQELEELKKKQSSKAEEAPKPASSPRKTVHTSAKQTAKAEPEA